MAQTGDIRFEINWVDGKGMDAAGDDRDPADHTYTRRYRTFDQAAQNAFKVADADYYGAVQIARITCTSAKYNWWECDRHWHAERGGKPSELNENEPEYVEVY